MLNCRAGIFLSLVFILLTAVSCSKPKQVEETIVSNFKPKPRNVVLIVDTSGSMNRNDANRMTLYSSMLFVDLLESNDHLSVLSFPSRSIIKTAAQLDKKINKWAASSESMIIDQSKPDMKNWVRNLEYDSNFTIFKEPLQKAYAIASDGTDETFSQRVVVFFSDGGTDRHNPSRSNPRKAQILKGDHEIETAYLRDQFTPMLNEKNITFHGVVLGSETVSNHFDIMAGKTGGLVRKVSDPEGLAKNFTEIFSKILQTEVENQTFFSNQIVSQTINNYVKELLIIVPANTLEDAKKVDMHLSEPGSSRLSDSLELHTASMQKSAKELWERTSTTLDGLRLDVKGEEIEAGGYVIWRIQKPQAGEWKIQLEGESPASVKAIVIQNYGIYLEVGGRKERYGMVGEPNAFKARLVTEDGEPIVDPDFYKKHNFRFEFRKNGKLITDLNPNERYQMLYDYIPPEETKDSKIEIVAKNDLFLNVNVPINFTAFKDVNLKINGSVDFGSKVPWTDWFLEYVGKLLGDAIWEKGSKWDGKSVEADFRGSAINAEGVRFKIDNTELYRRMKARVLSKDGEETFYIDKNMTVRFCIDIDRDSHGGDLSGIKVPITTVSGKPVSGVTHFPLKGTIKPLSPWTWKYSHWWLEELFILWLILFFIGKPFIYINWNSFPKSKRYFAGGAASFRRALKKGSANKAANFSMGRPFFLRLIMGYFQFLWGTQITKSGTMLQRNPISRIIWIILGAVLPVSMADMKRIYNYDFYRYKGRMLIKTDQYNELSKLEKGRGKAKRKDNARQDSGSLRIKENVNQAKVMKGKMVLHIT